MAETMEEREGMFRIRLCPLPPRGLTAKRATVAKKKKLQREAGSGLEKS
jgi:hypothetical protein